MIVLLNRLALFFDDCVILEHSSWFPAPFPHLLI